MLMSTMPLLEIVDEIGLKILLQITKKKIKVSGAAFGVGVVFFNLPFTTQSPLTRLRMLTADPKLQSISDQLLYASVYKDSELLQLPHIRLLSQTLAIVPRDELE